MKFSCEVNCPHLRRGGIFFACTLLPFVDILEALGVEAAAN